jgi:hypothetical protein
LPVRSGLRFFRKQLKALVTQPGHRSTDIHDRIGYMVQALPSLGQESGDGSL